MFDIDLPSSNPALEVILTTLDSEGFIVGGNLPLKIGLAYNWREICVGNFSINLGAYKRRGIFSEFFEKLLYTGRLPRRSNPCTLSYTCDREGNSFIYLPQEMVPLSYTYSRNTPISFFVGSVSVPK